MLTWCRYTFFIVLYPVGIYGELTLLGTASSWFAEQDKGAAAGASWVAPALKLFFVYKLLMQFFMLLYIPCS